MTEGAPIVIFGSDYLNHKLKNTQGYLKTKSLL
jgi:hypothetical protein